MEVLEESLIRKTLEKFKELKFATIFGSHRKRKNDEFSDLDVFIVCKDNKDKNLINNKLSKLDIRITQEIHTNIFTSDEIERRLRCNDYLLASILEDSIFLFGEKDCFFEAKQRILTSKPNENSMKFNRNMGTKILSYTNELFQRFQNFSESSAYEKRESFLRREFFLMGVKNYHLGLGYLLASIQMKKLNKTISLRHLLSEDISLLKQLIWIEKRIRRNVKQYVM